MQAVLGVVVVEVALAGQLGDSVGGERVLRVVFSCREPLLLTVYGPAGRGEDYLAHPILDASLEEADCSQDVHVGVEVRLPDRASDIHLGCLVAECLRPKVLEDLCTPGADICLVEVYPLRYVLTLAAGKVVDYGHFVVAPEESFGHVGADKPCAPLSKTLIARRAVPLC